MGRYDQLVLSERSPAATYYEMRKEWPTENISPENSGLPNNTCAGIRTPSRWLLRGLWPNRHGGSSPIHCDPLVEGYVSSFINETLKNDLLLYWPNILTNNRTESFYEYLWHRHGSCAKNAKGMADVEGYFTGALELLHKNNVGRLLEEADIVPGDSYSLQRIYDLIKNAYKSKPRLRCLRVKNSEQQEEQYLLEVTICFNKRLLYQDCLQYGIHSSCDKKKLVNYATIKKV